jgi:spore coat polysaccharide biosynthesis protein SpsF
MKDQNNGNQNPRIFAIVQARMGSTRLPGKVLKPLGGRPMLSHLLERLQTAQTLTGVVVATSTLPEDEVIVQFAESCGVTAFTGSAQDVLARYVGAAKAVRADVIARITADCPLNDPQTVDRAIRHFLAHDFDIVIEADDKNKVSPRGLDVAVCSMEALLRTDKLAHDGPSREHVTLYMYRHPEEFKIGYYPVPPELQHPEWRLCVDEPADFRLMEEIFARLGRPGHLIDIAEVAALFQREPALIEINRQVQQKIV